MSLLSDMKGALALEGEYDDPVDLGVDCVLVEDEIVDTTRWSLVHEATFLRKTIKSYDPLTFQDEYVTVVYEEPATEEQDGGDFGVVDIYGAEPVEVIRFQRKV